MPIRIYPFQRISCFFAAKRTLYGVGVAVSPFLTRDEKSRAFDKVDFALKLIEQYAPESLAALRSDARFVLVEKLAAARGSYFHKLRLIGLDDEWVLDKQTTVKSMAGTLIHEAQHARLFRLGFGYEDPIRARIEKICYRAQRNFLQRLPNSAKLVAQTEAIMNSDLEVRYATEARRQAKLEELRNLDLPEWILTILDWLSRRFAT